MQELPPHGHDPVMLKEVLEHLAPALRAGTVVMDCTVGRGGHAAVLAQALAQAGGGTLIALDVDPENLKFARKRVEADLAATAAAAETGRVEIRTFHANFGEAADVLDEVEMNGIDVLLADFGVSTNQILDEKHGLSFNAERPLDMRLDPRITVGAADIVATWDEKKLASILTDYAQERFAWRIARKIASVRATEPILTTGQLARLVRAVVPAKYGQIDPATRTFQALRMAVNSELESINDLLAAVPDMMNPEGRAVFISFHSGEDRLVKQATRQWEQDGLCELLNKKPLEPGEEEMNKNPRSRSAKLRAVRFLRQSAKDGTTA